MKTYKNLWKELYSYENLLLAFQKARKHKTLKPYVIEFQKDLKNNLMQLQADLIFYSYRPKPLKTFILREPKTRKISKSDFRDRIIHHAVCNIIEPFFEKSFICDSYANRIGKGTLKALKRFDYFKKRVSKNNTRKCFVLKADVKHYFDTVDHEILLNILKKKIKDEKVIWLIKQILINFNSNIKGKGMPLGNLTSQFFANVYLNELDYFVKHKLKVRYYIRYVDDFVIFGEDKNGLVECKDEINSFLKTLKLELHPDKSKIRELNRGICFLGFRVFFYHKLLKRCNINKLKRKLLNFKKDFEKRIINYDKIYTGFEGWIAYSKTANSYWLRLRIAESFEQLFPNEISDVEINRLLHQEKPI